MPTVKSFPWKRFWCRREDTYNLGDRGFLIDPTGKHGELLNPHLTTFDQLQAVNCLALLGEPGVGKSWSLMVDVDAFRKQSPDLPMIRLDLRSFGSEDRLYKALFENQDLLQWINGDYDLHLYLDSFDECLLRIDTIAALLADELSKLPLNRLKLRIACRTAPWPLLLENALKTGYGNDNFAATELVPLRRVDVLEAATLSGISKPGAFLERVDQLQIAALASKPITLMMLLDTFQREGDLPANLLDLYEKGCLILCEEQNENRRAAGRIGTLSPESRMAVAARIAAVTQFGNRFAVWTGTEAAGVPLEDVSVSQLVGGNEFAEQEIDVSNQMIIETLGTGLFSSRGSERLGWSHQTFAEYLAARYCITHKLPIQQVRSLIFHPRRARVIPQIREVASWLALQNHQLFSEIAEHDPEVLLGSASPSLSHDQRSILTAALLRRCDESEFLHIHHLPLRNLAHPGLAGQLESVLRDLNRSMTTRYFAASIARDCSVTSLGETLLRITLSETETNDLRKIAGYVVADVGTEEEREQLRPLLQASREIDPNDELRGVALQAIYPGDKYDDEMWNYIEHPRRSLFFGSYNSFLSYSVIPKLNATNLPAALRWCMRQSIEDLGPIPELEAEIFYLAAENIAAEGVADLVAQAVFERCKSYRGFPKRNHGNNKDAEDLLNEDDARRRRFLEAFIPLLNAQNVHIVMHPLSILTVKDLPWFIDRIVNEATRSPQLEAKLIVRLVCSSWTPDAMKAVWDACQINAIIAEECKGLFEPASLEEAAKWKPPSREEYLKEHNIQMAPALGPRIEAALNMTEAGQVDEWLRLISEMSLEEGKTHYVAFREMDLAKLPGWTTSSEETRSRILDAAKQYLTQSTFPELEPAVLQQARYGASAGVNALAMLHLVDRCYLQSQPASFWARWISSLVEDDRAGREKESGIASVFRLAAESDPDTMNARLLEQLRLENAGQQQFFFSSTMFDLAWSESLGLLLLDELRQNNLVPSIQGDVLYKLLHNDVPSAREWAEATIQTEHDSERRMALSRAFLNVGEVVAWPVLWTIIQDDAAFGRELLENVSYGRPDKSAFATNFSDVQLEEFYGWLLEQYPPTDDRQVSGAVGPVDTVRFLRDGTLELLKNRGTFEACDVLSRVELRFPQHRWLRYHFDKAEVLACALTWEAPSPNDILAMSGDRSKRFVESSEHLLDAIQESLGRLQRELHGELASVADLWNSERGEWWPKQEEDVSDYIARFLRRDLVERGIVVNREVQIRRGRDTMQGQNTDIHVDAPPTEGSQTMRYGTISVVIEVKGSWNNGLMIDMQGQLRDRYMKNSGCRVGLYVVAHFATTNWRTTDHRKVKSEAWDIDDLRQRLVEQAVDLSGGVLIRSFVLDASLDSTKATGVEEENEVSS